MIYECDDTESNKSLFNEVIEELQCQMAGVSVCPAPNENEENGGLANVIDFGKHRPQIYRKKHNCITHRVLRACSRQEATKKLSNT